MTGTANLDRRASYARRAMMGGADRSAGEAAS